MTDEPICIDANLIVRRVTGTGDAEVDEAWQRWRAQRTRFIAPILQPYELTNAIYRLYRFAAMPVDEARDALASALAVPVELQSEPRDHVRALELATRFTMRSAYDAHYLALAERLGIEFWTRDERIVNAVRRHLPWVHLVGEDA